MQWFSNLRTVHKLALGFGLAVLLTLLVGAVSLSRMAQMNDNARLLKEDSIDSLEIIVHLVRDARQYCQSQYHFLLETDSAKMDALEAEMKQTRAAADADMDQYGKSISQSAEDRSNFQDLKAHWTTYEADHEETLRIGRRNDTKAEAKHVEKLRQDFQGVADALDKMTDWNSKRGDFLARDASATYASARTTMTFIMLIALLAGCFIAWSIARLIAHPLADVAAAAKGLSVGDIEQQVTLTRRDEVGQVAEAFRALIAYQKEMASAAEAMAGGDLSQTVDPKSAKDALGNAFAAMTTYQKEMAAVALAMSEGDVTRTVQPKSAKDALGNAFAEMTTYQKGMASVAEAMASGDLTRTIHPKSDKDVLGNAFAKMVVNLSQLIARTRMAAQNIVQASGEVSTGTLDLSQRTEEQASSLEETASSMEEMTATVKQNAENARQANQLAAQARDVAQSGGDVVSNAVSSMEEINQASKRIADIISVIDEIAFQTNLLALNAAVEAARVGEQGRGFAVVAAEVRNLAGRSATAAKEIKALVQDSVQKVQEGSGLVNQSGTQLEEIVTSVKKVADIIAEISAASQEQAAGIEQVNKAVMQMDQITQQNAALVEEAATSSQSMTDQARDLDSIVAQFQLEASYMAEMQRQQAMERPKAQAHPVAATGTDGPARGRQARRKPTTHLVLSHLHHAAESKSAEAAGDDEKGFEEF